MKHLLCYLVAAVAIFTFINVFVSADHPQAASSFRGTNAAAVPVEARTLSAKVGLLTGDTATMEDLFFRSSLEQGLAEDGLSVHACETGSSAETQWAMYEKMLDEGYSVVFLSLLDQEEAARYAQAAAEKGVALVFLGDTEPSQEVISLSERFYYLGFSDGDSLREAAAQIAQLWKNNQPLLDHFADGTLTYSFLSDESFQESGKAAVFQEDLARRGVSGALAKDSVTSYFSFDIQKEIDRIWVADTELIVCTSSSDARKSLNYLNDPTEFKSNHIKMVLLTADEAARKMVENEEILLAIGVDGQELGRVAAALTKALAAGEAPAEADLGVSVPESRRLYVSNTILRSPAMDSVAEQEPETDSE